MEASPASRLGKLGGRPDLLKFSFRGLHWRLAAVFALVAAITFVLLRVVPVNAITAGFSYLIAILVIAAGWGFAESVVASLLAVLCFNFFFFEPVGTLNIKDPQNWVALIAFLATAMIASELSALARNRTEEAIDRRMELERLYSLSRAILLTDPARPASHQIAERIAEIFGLDAIAIHDARSGALCQAGTRELAGIAEMLKRAGNAGLSVEVAGELLITPVAIGGQRVGTLALQDPRLSPAAIQALTQLVAIGLERAHNQEVASRSEAARQSQELKSTLLDAIAHEFKTPLTSIKASASALLSSPAGLPWEQRELATIVDEEADRLSRLVTEAIQMARIEAGKVQLAKEVCDVTELIRGVLEEMQPLVEGRTLAFDFSTRISKVLVDRQLLRLAIRQIVDNALRYSPPNSPVEIRVENADRLVVIDIADRGPGIPEDEQEKIFENFYRSPHTRQNVAGSGMGLAIAREIIRKHGGDVSVENVVGDGAIFSFQLPAADLENRS